MKYLVTLLNEIEFEPNKKENLPQKFPLLEKKINKIIFKIKLCNSFDETEYYFALLGSIQNIIMKLRCIDQISVPENLWSFAKDFDRIDDEFTQKYLYNQIKADKYTLTSND